MSHKPKVTVSNLESIHTDNGVDVTFFDIHVGCYRHHKVVVKTNKKFREYIKTKILQNCKGRQKGC